MVGKSPAAGQGGGRAAARGDAPDGRTGAGSEMTAGSAGNPGAGGVLQPVAPALFVRVVIRPMTKVLNPVIVRFAGRRHFPMAAQIRHVGRRSGKAYVTPATAHLHGDVILIALTFGNQSVCSHHLRATGGCSIRLNGPHYHATH